MKRLLALLLLLCSTAFAETPQYPTPPLPYCVLDTTHIISVKMGEGTTTTAPTFSVAYVDSGATLFYPGAADGSFTTSYAQAVAAPAQNVRNISAITICNLDTVTHTIYVIKAPSGTPATITSGLIVAYSIATNTTVTLGTSGVVSSTPLALPLTVPNGGTGDTTLTVHGVLLGEGTSAVTVTAAGASGAMLVGQGASDPTWNAMSGDATLASTGALTLAASNTHQTTISNLASIGTITTGVWNGTTIAVANGGTSSTTLTAHSLLVGNGTSALAFLAPGTSGNLAQSNGTDFASVPMSGDATIASGGALSIGAGKVTNTMLAGSITASKLVGSDIATVGTITSGVWNGTTITVPNGGTGATTETAHGVLLGEGTGAFAATAAGTAGQMLRSAGAAADPIWSTPTFPNTAASANVMIGDGTNWVQNAVTGDVTIGATGVTAIGATKVTNAMLAGSIAASKLVGSDIATVGTITSGVWNGTVVATLFGGTGAALTPAIGDLLYASSSTVFARLADVTAGSYLRSGGATTAPLWSTLTLPNAATQGDVLIATAANTVGVLVDVAAGSYLRSGGVSTAPLWSTQTLPNTSAAGDIFISSAANTGSTLADVAVGKYLRSGGVGVAPLWSTPTLPNTATNLKLLIGDGTNWGESTPAYPNASVTLNKWIRSDGTNYIASTGTLPDNPTAGDIMYSSGGTNWSNLNIGGAGKYVRSNGTVPSYAYPMQEQPESALFTAAAADNMSLFVCDVTGGGYTATLPSVGTVGAGYCIWFQLVQHGLTTSATGTNILTIACNAADGVNGMNTLTSTASTLYLCRDGECIGLMACAAGGYRRNQGWSVITYESPNCAENAVYNPCGVVAQRPANAVPAINVWTYGTTDRWAAGSTVAPGAAWTVAQDAAATTPTGYAFGLTSATITAGPIVFRQVIEAKDAIMFNGRVAVFSANVNQNSGSAVNYIMNIYPNTAADNSTKSSLTGSAISSGNLGANQSVASGTWTTICSGPVQMGTSAKNGFVLEIKTAAVTVTTKAFELSDVCLQPGTVMLPFRHRSQQEELARAQRYCYVPTGASGTYVFAVGIWTTATTQIGSISFPVTMYKIPSLSFSGTISHLFIGTAAANYAVTTNPPTIVSAAPTSAYCIFTASTGAGTANNSGDIGFITATASDMLIFDSDF